MTDTSPVPRPLAPDDALPPVEPPSAGFIVQLFVIPAVIVAVILAVWFLLNLANIDRDPKELLAALKSRNERREQALYELIAELNRNEPLRRDEAFFRDYTLVLDEWLADSSQEKREVDFRSSMLAVTGTFNLPDAVPVLVKGYRGGRDDEERTALKLGALIGLRNVLPTIRQVKPQDDSELRAVVDAAADDPSYLVRYHDAYVLEALGDPRSVDTLKKLLRDPNVDVRMNAALAAAPLGVAEAVPELAKMLDPADDEGVLTEQKESYREKKRMDIYIGALNAARRYVEKSPQADRTALTAAVDKLLASNPELSLRLAAEDVRRELVERPKS